MSADQPDSGPAALARALNVPRNARWGFGLAAAITVAVYVFFVVIPGTTESPAWYLALAFVLAASLGGLLTAILTARSAVRLARRS